MKKSILLVAGFCLSALLQAASPNVGRVIKKSYPAYGKDMPVLVCWSETDVPAASEELGTLQVTSQEGVNCADSATVVRLLQREARMAGGNTLQITAHRVNGGCHQMMATVLRTDEDVLFNEYPDIYTAVLSPFKSARQNLAVEKGASSTRNVSRVIKKAYPAYAGDMPVLVCWSEGELPPDVETLGTLQTNNTLDANRCDSVSVAELLKQETRRVGGNVLLVTGCRVSRGCYQMMGTIMRTSENRMRALFPEAYAQTFSSPERQAGQSLFSKVRFEVGAGYAYRTASTMPGLPAVTDNLVSKLKHGASIQAAVDFFPSRYMGVGLMYYTYRSKSDLWIATDNYGNGDDLEIHDAVDFIAPTYVTRTPIGERCTFDTRLGVGYIHYQDKITLLNQEVAIKGGSIGFHAMLGVEYKLGKALGLFLNVSTTQGWISKARMVGDGVDETIDLQDQNTIESLSQISIGAGLRFHIGQR